MIVEIKTITPPEATSFTGIFVDGQFAYSSANAIAIEQMHLEALFKLLKIEGIIIRSIFTTP